MNGVVDIIALIILCSAVGEGIIEFLISPIVDLFLPETNPDNTGKRTITLHIVSGILGVAIAVSYHISLFRVLGAESAQPVFGEVLTGLLLGRGSNYIHSFIENYIKQTGE